MSTQMAPVTRPVFIDYLAPDHSENRLLKNGETGGLCECTLGPCAVTKPVSHMVVEELWNARVVKKLFHLYKIEMTKCASHSLG